LIFIFVFPYFPQPKTVDFNAAQWHRNLVLRFFIFYQKSKTTLVAKINKHKNKNKNKIWLLGLTILVKFTLFDCSWGHFFKVTNQATN